MLHDSSRRCERCVVAVVLLVFVALNVMTLERLPIVAIDEVSYSDPGVNLALGNGFVSTAWYSQGDDQVFASNAPLYPLVLAGWLKLVGFSVSTVRLLNIILAALALLAGWLAVRNLGVAKAPALRVLFLILISTGTGMVFAFRFGRYDTLMMLLVTMSAACASIRTPILRAASLFLLGLCCPWAGLQLLPYLTLSGALLLVFVGNAVLSALVPLAVGASFGLASLLTWLKLSGSWAVFRSAVMPHVGVGRSLPEVCPSWALLLAVLVVLIAVNPGLRVRPLKSPACIGVAFGLVVPFALAQLGKFPRPYFWMAYIPMAAATVGALDRTRWSSLSWALRRSIEFLLAVCCLVGLPAYVAIVGLEWRQRDYSPVVALVQRNVQSTDVVFCDWSAYYPAKRLARQVYLPTYDVGWAPMMSWGLQGGAPLPDEARRAISLVLVRPEAAAAVIAMLGGQWVDTRDSIGNRAAARSLRLPFGRRLGSAKYDLRVFRRTGPESVSLDGAHSNVRRERERSQASS